jgi:phytoene dehydrogenase-like protein
VGNYDAIIIGAGHNGLVTAGYLAKAGRKVLVLERRSIVGGAAVTEEIFPGFKVSSVADGSGYLSKEVRRDLKLDTRIETIASDVVAFCPQPDGSHLTIYRDSRKTVQEIARISRADAEAYPGFINLMQAVAGVVGGLMHMTPLDLPDVGLGSLRGAIGLIGPGLKLGRKRITDLLRVLPMPAADILNEYISNPVRSRARSAPIACWALPGGRRKRAPPTPCFTPGRSAATASSVPPLSSEAAWAR